MCLPKYCWVCCFNCSVDSGAKFFAIFRLICSGLSLLTILENIITGKTQQALGYLESVFHKDLEHMLKETGEIENSDDDSDIAKYIAEIIFKIAMLLMAVGILYSIVEIIVSSLAIHGMRRARPKMLLPYIIWTSFLVMLPIASMILMLGLIIFLTIMGVPVEINIVVLYISFFITFGLIFGWILWDLLIVSSRYKQLKNAVGMDHMMLQEVPNDEKEKMLYPQLT